MLAEQHWSPTMLRKEDITEKEEAFISGSGNGCGRGTDMKINKNSWYFCHLLAKGRQNHHPTRNSRLVPKDVLAIVFYEVDS